MHFPRPQNAIQKPAGLPAGPPSCCPAVAQTRHNSQNYAIYHAHSCKCVWVCSLILHSKHSCQRRRRRHLSVAPKPTQITHTTRFSFSIFFFVSIFFCRVVSGFYSPLQQLGTALIHLRVLAPLGLAKAFIALLADSLAVEALLHIVAQVIGIVEERLDFQKALQLVHHIDGIEAQLLAIDYMHLLGGIVGQPVLQMLCVFARIKAPIPQILQCTRRRIAGSYDLCNTKTKHQW